MKLASLSLFGLAAAIAGLRPANGQDSWDCQTALMADEACSNLGSPTTCEGNDETALNLAVCCAQADVDAAAVDVTEANDALTAAEQAIADANAALVAAQEAVADADTASTEADENLDEKEAELSDLCSDEPPPTSEWAPTVGQTWNYHLNAGEQPPETISPDADVYMIDMDAAQVGDTIAALHAAGKYVVCYISIGTWESWRDDADDFPAEALGNPLYDWEGEKWLDTTFKKEDEADPAVHAIMTARVAKGKSLSCDGIEPDNMSVGYEDDTGVGVTMEDSRVYADWFRALVQGQGMKVGMKNLVWSEDAANLGTLASNFDFAINEECYDYEECGLPKQWFIDVGKPVFHVEYKENYRGRTMRDMCRNKEGSDYDDFSTIVKTYPLWGPYCTCDGDDNNTDVWRCARGLDTNF